MQSFVWNQKQSEIKFRKCFSPGRQHCTENGLFWLARCERDAFLNSFPIDNMYSAPGMFARKELRTKCIFSYVSADVLNSRPGKAIEPKLLRLYWKLSWSVLSTQYLEKQLDLSFFLQSSLPFIAVLSLLISNLTGKSAVIFQQELIRHRRHLYVQFTSGTWSGFKNK